MVWEPPKPNIIKPRCDRCGKLKYSLGGTLAAMAASVCCCGPDSPCFCNICTLPQFAEVTLSGVELTTCAGCPDETRDFVEINQGVNDTYTMHCSEIEGTQCTYGMGTIEQNRVRERFCSNGDTVREWAVDGCVEIVDDGGTLKVFLRSLLSVSTTTNRNIFVGCGEISQCEGTHTLMNAITGFCSDDENEPSECCSIPDSCGCFSGPPVGRNGSAEIEITF